MDDFVEGVFHDTLGTQRLQPRDDEAHSRLRNDGFHGHPVAPGELGNSGRALGRQRGDDLGLECLVEHCTVQGMALMLHEALSNLIDNAIHHGHPGQTRITVRVGADGITWDREYISFERVQRVSVVDGALRVVLREQSLALLAQLFRFGTGIELARGKGRSRTRFVMRIVMSVRLVALPPVPFRPPAPHYAPLWVDWLPPRWRQTTAGARRRVLP